jgi:hypothetical protein
VPIEFTAGLTMEASGNRLPYLTHGKRSSLNLPKRSLTLDSHGVLGTAVSGEFAEPSGHRASNQGKPSDLGISSELTWLVDEKKTANPSSDLKNQDGVNLRPTPAQG